MGGAEWHTKSGLECEGRKQGVVMRGKRTEKANKLMCGSELVVKGSMKPAASGTDCTAAQLRESTWQMYAMHASEWRRFSGRSAAYDE